MHRLLPWIPDIQKATFVDVQNVSDYFWHDKREFWDLNDFRMSPPWPFFATRYTVPTEVYSEEKGTNPLRRFEPGTEILTVFRETAGIPSYSQLVGRPGKTANSLERIPMPGAKWYYDIWVFPVLGKVVQPPMMCWLALDERGLPAMQPGRNVRAFFAAQEYREYKVQFLPVSYLHVSGLALTFLHSRNVHVLPPDPQMARPNAGSRASDLSRAAITGCGWRRWVKSGSAAKARRPASLNRFISCAATSATMAGPRSTATPEMRIPGCCLASTKARSGLPVTPPAAPRPGLSPKIMKLCPL